MADQTGSSDPIDLVGPKGYVHGWIHVGGTEDLVPAGKVRAGSYVRIQDKSYKVTANRKHFRGVPGMRTIDLQAQEDVGIRHRMVHRGAERDLMSVLRPPGGKPHPHTVASEPPPAPVPAGPAHPLAGARAAHAAARGISTAEVRRRSSRPKASVPR